MLHLLRPDLVDRPTRRLKSLPDLPLAKMIIRNRKHLVTDAKGKKIFYGIGNATILAFHPTEAEIAFAGEVKNYLRHGYDEAGKLDSQERSAVGFLMATFGKLASSSREALKSALQRRVDVLRGTQSELEGGNREMADEDAASAVGGAMVEGVEPDPRRGESSSRSSSLGSTHCPGQIQSSPGSRAASGDSSKVRLT